MVGNYACDPSAESYSRYGRLAVTVPAPSLGDDLTPVGRRIPDNYSGNRLISEYYSKYVPRHWKKMPTEFGVLFDRLGKQHRIEQSRQCSLK